MIIKHPDHKHKTELSELWQEAFCEPEEAFETFYATAFSPDRSMICVKEEKVVAGLYWFDCLWNGKKVAYLYAIATKQEHQGKGICTKLMTATHAELTKRGYAGAILVPAEESLFSFYGKQGYLPCVPQEMHNAKCIMQNAPISASEYEKLQKSLLPENAIVHTDTAFSYLSHFATFHKTEKGILCKTDEEVQELLPYTPGDKPSAMYLPLTEDKALPSYFGLPLA